MRRKVSYYTFYIPKPIQIFFGQLYNFSSDVLRGFGLVFFIVGLTSVAQGIVGVVGCSFEDINAMKIVSEFAIYLNNIFIKKIIHLI